MLKITIEGATFDDLKNSVANLAQQLGAAPAAATTSNPTKPAAAAAPKAAAPKAEAPVLDYKKDVGPLILKLADKSRDKAVELLGQFGVSKGTELKPAQFAEFVTAAKAAIDTADEALG